MVFVFIFILCLSNKIVVIISNNDIISIKFFDKIILCKENLCIKYSLCDRRTNNNYFFKVVNKVN